MQELFLNGKRVLIRRGHRLKVSLDGKEITGVVKVLQSGTAVVPLVPPRSRIEDLEPDGAERRKGFEVVIRRGRDADPVLQQWFSLSQHMAAPEVRRDIDIEVLDENDMVLASYSLLGCVPSGLLVLPCLVPGGGVKGVEELRVECQGLVIDDDR